MIRLQDITEGILSYNPDANIDLIWKAYVYSAKVHRGQLRASGEPYLSHPLEVAYLLTRLKMDEESLVVGLLHDTLEDTFSTEEEIEELFGKEILGLVDGLTKISRIEFSSSEERQAENYRKMILAMSKDIRVIIVKLSDRLHNMRTLEFMSPDKQKKISLETMGIYAPLANRLGMGWVKQELEDISFRYIHPEEFKKIDKGFSTHYEERMTYINEVTDIVKSELGKSGIDASVAGRSKHFYSIHRKMQKNHIRFEQVHDILGIRIITGSVKECYSILGTIHAIWTPIPGKIKDYIAMPKANMYQSLHTTVIGPKGHRVEFQIRTAEMHNIAEEGIAAHWKYKETGTKDTKRKEERPDKGFAWLRQMIEWQREMKDPKEFLESMRIEFYSDEVYVFTPAGDVRELPQGATPIDFAYYIHTDVGHQCVGARVNGNIVPLKYQLKNGDIVEIMTSSSHRPNRDLLKIIRTSKARLKIRAFLKEEQKERSVALGREIVEKEIKKYHLQPDDYLKPDRLQAIAKLQGLATEENLFAAVGFGKYPVRSLMSKLIPSEIIKEKREKEKWSLRRLVNRVRSKKLPKEGVKIKGVDDILIRFAKCCTPLPGDSIVGFISRGRGVTIHAADCSNSSGLTNDPDRKIDVEWDIQKKSMHGVKIVITTVDRPGILGLVSNAIASKNVNISEAVAYGDKEGGGGSLEFLIEIADIKQLQEVINAIKSVKGVKRVERVNKDRQGKKVLKRKKRA